MVKSNVKSNYIYARFLIEYILSFRNVALIADRMNRRMRNPQQFFITSAGLSKNKPNVSAADEHP